MKLVQVKYSSNGNVYTFATVDETLQKGDTVIVMGQTPDRLDRVTVVGYTTQLPPKGTKLRCVYATNTKPHLELGTQLYNFNKRQSVEAQIALLQEELKRLPKVVDPMPPELEDTEFFLPVLPGHLIMGVPLGLLKDQYVKIRFRSGNITTGPAGAYRWHHTDSPGDIVGYKVV
jgi:hypothetical protein